MPRTLGAGLEAHLALETTTLATVVKVVRADGVELFFTDHDQELTVDGDVYEPSAGFNRTNFSAQVAMAVDNLNITGIFDSATITDEDVLAGRYDGAEVTFSLVNWADTSQGTMILSKGMIGEARMTPQGFFFAEIRGLSQHLQQSLLKLYGPLCRVNLGSTKCGIPVLPDVREDSTAYAAGDHVRVATAAGDGSFVYEDRIYECTVAGTTDASPPVFDTTVGNTTVDGTATWTAREAWNRACEVVAVTDRRTFEVTELLPSTPGTTPGRDYFPSDSLNDGAVTWETGDNEGLTMEVLDFTAGTPNQEIVLHLPMGFDIQVGDVLRVYRGCDRTLETCRDVFDNVVNHRGEHYVPGSDVLFRIPDA